MLRDTTRYLIIWFHWFNSVVAMLNADRCGAATYLKKLRARAREQGVSYFDYLDSVSREAPRGDLLP